MLLVYLIRFLRNRSNRSVFHYQKPYQGGYVSFFLKQMNSGAERFNGLMAMIGIVAGIGAYATTGQFVPGIF